MLLAPSAQATQFTYGDPANLLAPGINGTSLFSAVAARKSDGTIWVKQVEPSIGSWASLGSPAGGATSGPASAIVNNTAYYFVRGASGVIYENHGSGWSNRWGSPPGGAGSAPNVSAFGTSPFMSLQLVVIDNNNSPWTRQLNSDNTLGAWTKIGTNSVVGVPGIAISSTGAPNIFSLDANRNTIYIRCTFGSCFQTWNSYGPGLGNSGTSAIAYMVPSTGSANVSVALLGTDNRVWVSTSTVDGSAFGGFSSLGGPAADSSPAISYFSTANRTLVAVHRPDGNQWVYGQIAGQWLSIGHP